MPPTIRKLLAEDAAEFLLVVGMSFLRAPAADGEAARAATGVGVVDEHRPVRAGDRRPAAGRGSRPVVRPALLTAA